MISFILSQRLRILKSFIGKNQNSATDSENVSRRSGGIRVAISLRRLYNITDYFQRS